jgi:hypothetical protein
MLQTLFSRSARLVNIATLMFSAAVTASAATPTHFVISGPVAPVAGTCAAMQAIAEDSHGNPAPVAANTTVRLNGSLVGFLFTGIFSDAACKQATVTALLPAGSTTVTFYFSDKVVQQVTVSAVAPKLKRGTLVVNVAPAPPVSLAVSGFGYMKTTSCSSALAINVADAFGNPSPVMQPLLITFSNYGSATIYDDTACTHTVSTVTVPAGSASVSIYLRDPEGETFTLTVSAKAYRRAAMPMLVAIPSGPPFSKVGAGKVAYTCPSGATVIGPPQNGVDNLSPIVASSSPGQTLCIEGEHRVAAPLTPKPNQTWIGIGGNVRISGAVRLTEWQPFSTGVWTYTGPYSTQMNTLVDFAVGLPSCYTVSIYQDDLFYRKNTGADDQRIMRVLSVGELTGALTTPGQAETPAENQRFFFDYIGLVTGSRAIYINFDPTNYIVDLPIIQNVITGTGVGSVTIQNLTLEKALNTVIATGNSWNLQDTTIRFGHNYGLLAASGIQTAFFTMNRVSITNNGQYGMLAGNYSNIQNSDFSWGNIANYRKRLTLDSSCGGYFASGGMKAVHIQGLSASSPGLTIANSIFHHNIGDGGWDDVGGQFITIQGNHFFNNEGSGYSHEIGCDILFSGNEVDHNGASLKNSNSGVAALIVNDSNNGTFVENKVHDNRNGIINLFFQSTHTNMLSNPCLGASNDGDTSNAMKNNLVQSNQIYYCHISATVGQTDSNLQTAMARNNRFVSNTYHMRSSGGAFWWNPFAVTWSQWQADGQDPDGTLIVGCTYP